MPVLKLKHGDCLAVLKSAPDNYADSLVTDPPAGISFMGKSWDDDKGGRDAWVAWMTDVMRECLRVLKPGAHGLVWALPRTAHWTATALEDAGFEVRDCVTHLFGTGFPKSLDISKAIDKAAPATDAAKEWQGWGTALKPACEFWWLVRKPLSEKTVAANVLRWGTGGLNIDASRIGSDTIRVQHTVGDKYEKFKGEGAASFSHETTHVGRFPANLVLDEEAAAGAGEASRFFYVAKASKKDRGEGNTHPTVKSTALMEYLLRLVTPPNGVVLDPFMGSGSTGVAALAAGFSFTGIEKDEAYFAICKSRLESDDGSPDGT